MTVTEKIKKMGVGDDALDLVFRKARTYNAWLPKPVPDDLIHQLYDTPKWGPTSANINPARFVFLRSAADQLRPQPSQYYIVVETLAAGGSRVDAGMRSSTLIHCGLPPGMLKTNPLAL